MQDLRTRHNASAPTAEMSTAGTRTAAATSRLDPQITIAANRDTIIAGLEFVTWTATREAPLDEALTVTVRLTQEQNWLSNRSRRVTFAANEATADLLIVASSFSSNVTESGNLTATVDSVSGYDTGDATATVYLFSQNGPAMKVFLSQEDYQFAEDAADPFVTLVARAAAGMPRGATVTASLSSRGGTATSSGDYEAFSKEITVSEGDFTLENGLWNAQTRVPLTLVDDEIREGAESLTLVLQGPPVELQLSDPLGAPCRDDCPTSVEITDDEDIPAWELSVNPETIMEEDESSSTATLAITNGKTFAADQVLTFALAGTATEGVDYVVTPPDADQQTAGHQVILSAGSTSLDVTLTAADDDLTELNEEIEVSATHEGEAIGSTQTIPILDQERPAITLFANRDTIIAGLEDLLLTATREAPLDEALTVTVQLTQEQNWLSNTSISVTIQAGSAIHELGLGKSLFSQAVTESGTITATVDSVDGYDTSDATASLFVVSQEGPAVSVSLTHSSYLFPEDGEDTDLILRAQMASGMPRGATVAARVKSRGKSSSRPALTATSGSDYQAFDETLTLREQDYSLENGIWVARQHLPVTLLDDDVREGRERFRAVLDHALGYEDKIQLLNADTSVCPQGNCPYLVFIVDDEDIPEMDLSLSAEEIREEEEMSSAATVSITNGKTFAADHVVTFAFAGTATEGVDYRVTPADADQQTPDHQVILPAGSTSVDVTLTAVDDDVEDSNEEIEVSATLDGEAIGSPRTVRILNQEILPGITLAANRDTIIAGLENLVFTATREAPLDEALTVTLQLTQEQNWLSQGSIQLNFPAHGATSMFTTHASAFSSGITESGTIVAVVDSLSGYDTGDATATVYVVSQSGPAMKVSFSHEAYRFAEDRVDPHVSLVAKAVAGMPRGATVTFSVGSRVGTAQSLHDYEPLSEEITVPEEAFAFENGLWQTQYQLPVTLIDDDVREGAETFELVLQRSPSTLIEVQLSDLPGAPCQGDCATPVDITDDEDIPEWEFAVSEDEIREEGETSLIATASITNGKTFATDQVVTLRLGGDAIPGHDYHVTPADADAETPDHQVTLPAGASSAELTFTARNDDREEGDEKIRLSVTHDGNAIGSGTVRIIDRFPGPRVEITFEGVDPPRDEYTAGVATGPFTTRITFSERVEGFTQEDIDWQTHAGTTVDSTNIGGLAWDYKEVRAGLEYTVRVMPEQNGRLWAGIDPGAATSVATGDGNQLGTNSLWIDLPPNRMMVAPMELAVVAEDTAGARFIVVLTSEPSDTVTVTLSGTDGTALTATSVAGLTFAGPFWTVGRVVRVTAGADANTANETVRLTLSASGGGYHGQRVTVVVNVKDNGAGSDLGMSEDEALSLVDDVTPEAAAAALFGEGDLSGTQLDALDMLGNSNGDYDLGDLLSWIERCRRGEAGCGAGSADSVPGAGAALPAAGTGGQGGGTSRRNRGGGGSAARGRKRVRRIRRHAGRSWYGLALVLVASVTWACADDGVQPRPAAPDPGFLTVQLAAPPSARDAGALLVVEGPGIESVRSPGFEVFQSEGDSTQEIVVIGALSTGPIVQFRVPDRGLHALYRVRLLQVTGEDYLLRDLSAYSAAISR